MRTLLPLKTVQLFLLPWLLEDINLHSQRCPLFLKGLIEKGLLEQWT